MSSKLSLIVLVLGVVVGGWWLLKEKGPKEDPRIAPAEEELAALSADSLSDHLFKVTSDACVVEFAEKKEPFTRWSVDLSHPSFAFVIGGEMLKLQGSPDPNPMNGRFAVSRGWRTGDGEEKKNLRFPSNSLEIPYVADGDSMVWMGALSHLAEVCRPPEQAVYNEQDME